MQDFLEAVQTESDQVAAELQKLLSQLEPLVEKRLRLEQRARALQTVMTTYQLKGKASGPATFPGADRHFLDRALEILTREGELHYEQLLEKLVDSGTTVPGRNPAANLIAHMSRDERFKRVRRGTYAAGDGVGGNTN